MAELFETTVINGMTLSNRFVRSATWEGLAEPDGRSVPKIARMMEDLARGGVGLIISSHAFVSREGQAGRGQIGVYDDALLDGLAELARAAHAGGAKIALQLAHAGCQANAALSGLAPVGPNDEARDPGPDCAALDQAGIARLTRAFADAALRAKRAGFDAVQVHAAHGYLLSQFLSPAWNRRTDQYGGSPENRSRLLREVVRAVREAVGADYPVLLKINSEDFTDGGITPQESLLAAQGVEGLLDAVELSGGARQARQGFMPARPGRIALPGGEVYYRDAAQLFKQGLRIPLILVGGVRSFEVARDLVAEGRTDYVSLCRPLICEPNLVKRWREGDLRPSECVSDNACYGPGNDGRGIFCVTLEKKRAKAAR